MKKNRAEWEEVMERQAESGLSQSAYARREGLSVSTLQYWRQKLKRESGDGRADFIEVTPSLSTGTGEIELELPHGIVLRVRG